MHWGDARIEIRFIFRSNALIWLIFWSVKIEEPKKKNDKNRFMHETCMNSDTEKICSIDANELNEQVEYNSDGYKWTDISWSGWVWWF